ncbi:MAG: M14 family zinc carboxypeptidase [Bacteroidales bacterium]
MKRAVFITLLLSIVLTLAGQRQPGGQRPESKPANYYKLEGFRHGVSFFPQANLKQVEYKAGDSLTFDRYHTSDVVYEWLRRWTARYPDLLEMYEVGRSYENRPVYQVTLTNKKTGADTEKPAAFFEGGRHSGEVTAVETVMWMLKYFLDNYGKDPVITHIIDTKTIYLRPVNNPDGHNLYLQTAQSNRSTVRPYDNDGDGLLDEDAPEDIDGDGMILQMRWKDEKNGTMIPDPDDPTGRLMKESLQVKVYIRLQAKELTMMVTVVLTRME